MMTNKSKLENIRLATKGVYEKNAEAWDMLRPKTLYEKKWLDQFIGSIESPTYLLDLGCGTGSPIADYFIGKGFKVCGLDYAPAMIEIAKKNHPTGNWIVGDIRSLEFDEIYCGIYSWDAFFHLSQEEQRKTLPRICALIKKGGAILLTVGHQAGAVTGTVAGEKVFHDSLSIDDYSSILTKSGFKKILFYPEDKEAKGRSILLAYDRQKSGL